MTPAESQQLRLMVEQYVAAHPERAELDGNQLVLKPRVFIGMKVGWPLIAIFGLLFFVGSIAYVVRLVNEGYGDGELDALGISPYLLVATIIVAVSNYVGRSKRIIVHLGSGDVTTRSVLGSKPVTNLSRAYKLTRYGERVALIPVKVAGMVHYWVDERGTWKSRAFEYGAFKNVGELQTLEPVFSAFIWCFNPAARSTQPASPQ